MHESFLAYAQFRYLKWAVLVCVLSLGAYAWHQPPVPPNGGTWLGYVLGSVGAAIILLLLWFGIRKRQYSSTAGRLAGWLSAHVYLGISLIIVATLHTGFQFGWNVHTLAYVLMILVILSGVYGVFTYLRYPTRLTENRAGLSDEVMLTEIAELDRECLALADKVGPKAHEIVLRSIEGTVIGGSAWQQITRRAPRSRALAQADAALNKLEPGDDDEAAGKTMLFMADSLTKARGKGEVADMRRLLDLLSQKKALVERVQKDVQFHALISAWLFIHVPLSIALLGALLVHIVSVFFYW
jgi:hypothetical protein